MWAKSIAQCVLRDGKRPRVLCNLQQKVQYWRALSSSALAETVAEEEESSQLFHRSLEVLPRDVNKRATRKIREERPKWIPAILDGRGKIPSVAIQVPRLPLGKDFFGGHFALQERGKYKFEGPLYELRALPMPNIEENEPIISEETQPLPFVRIRAQLKNFVFQKMTEMPESASFILAPEEETAKVRVPLRFLNEEKCPGLRVGYLNYRVKGIDIHVPAGVKAPVFAEVDVGGMAVKKTKFARDVIFDGMNQGCKIAMDAETPVITISKS